MVIISTTLFSGLLTQVLFTRNDESPPDPKPTIVNGKNVNNLSA